MLSLRDIIDIFVINWKWFVLSAVVCVGLAYLYLTTQPNVYQRSAVMLVKDDGGSGGSSRAGRTGTDALMQLNGVMMGSSIKNEVYILQSHQLMKEVVRNLRLDVQYSYKNHLRRVSLYDKRPFTARFTPEETQSAISFNVTINGSQLRITKVMTKEGELDIDLVSEIGSTVKLPSCEVTFTPEHDIYQKYDGETVTVTHTSIESAANVYGSSLKASELDKESTLVGITYSDTNIKRAEDILNAVLEAYRKGIIDDKNRIAESTANFIDDRIALITQELSAVEGALAEYKQTNRVVDVKSDASVFLQQSSAARQRSIQLESQVAVVQYLLEELQNTANESNLIPTLSISDAGILAQIQRYNEQMLTRNRLIEGAGENNTQVKQLEENLSNMRHTIISSTSAHLSALNVQLRRAKEEEASLNSNISAVPQKEKQVLDIARQQSIKETLYTYLLNKREETALQLAITEANIRVVEQPFGSSNPIAPRKKVIFLVALLIGIIMPFIYFHVKNLLNMSVRGRRDVEQYTTIPVLGEIPHGSSKDGEVVVRDNKNDPVSEAFRMLRFSLSFVNNDARVIMFTSTTPGEGKTFISRNFAITLAMTGKSVILVDTDIRKRTQSKLSGNIKRDGLTSYLSGTVQDLKSLIVKEDDKSNVDILPAGILPPNPAELLMSNRLDQCIEELKKMYDYVVIDNVPALVVADAGIVNRVADVTLYVMREGKIDRRYLPELERLYRDKKFNHLCIVLNDCKLKTKKYGYGYGYGYSYGYGAGYGYGSNEEKKKS